MIPFRSLHSIGIVSIRFCLVGVSLVCFGLVASVSAEPLRVVSYNVENLFYPERDSIEGEPRDDAEWTPEGERHWSYTRYSRKVENIARVLTNIGRWSGVDVVGLQEVENARCVERLSNTLRRGEYGYVHYESPDRRGIDVALLYKRSRVDTLRSERMKVRGEKNGEELTTRDILYVCARVDRKDTLHFFVCHLPSQRGGIAESEWKRKAAKAVLQRAVDSILLISPEAQIIVMGDMNSHPEDDLSGLRNRMKGLMDEWTSESVGGTHKYHGQWTCLDQFYTSPAVEGKVYIYDAAWILEPDEKYLGLRPKRTYNGFQYQDGFSDHLPIVLEK